MKKQIIAIVFIVLAGFAFADKDLTKSNSSESPVAKTVSLIGKVVDFKSGEALTGVEVKLEETNTKAYTDLDGKFSFKEVKSGSYDIVVSYISYDKSLIENFKVNSDNNKISIKLQASK